MIGWDNVRNTQRHEFETPQPFDAAMLSPLANHSRTTPPFCQFRVVGREFRRLVQRWPGGYRCAAGGPRADSSARVDDGRSKWRVALTTAHMTFRLSLGNSPPPFTRFAARRPSAPHTLAEPSSKRRPMVTAFPCCPSRRTVWRSLPTPRRVSPGHAILLFGYRNRL